MPEFTDELRRETHSHIADIESLSGEQLHRVYDEGYGDVTEDPDTQGVDYCALISGRTSSESLLFDGELMEIEQ